MGKFTKRFVTDESGATSIEYAVIATGLALVIITGIQAIGTALNANLISISGSF